MGEADAKRFFPVFLDLEQRPVVIIGGGKAAEKRAKQLSKYGADVTVVTGVPSELLLEGEVSGALSIEQRSYVRGDLSGAFLAVCVEDDPEVRRAVYAEAEALGCLVNVVESPEFSNFLLPSVMRRGRLEVAISTGGGAPEVAKALRKQLEATLGDEWGAWILLIAETRGLGQARLAEDEEAFTAAIAHVSDSAIRDRLASGEALTAEMMLEEAASAAAAAAAAAAESDAASAVAEGAEAESDDAEGAEAE